jgi:hypothetical protein
MNLWKTMTEKKLFDHYSFRARLQPAFLALLPIAIGVMAWAPPGAKWMTSIWSLLSAAGFTLLLANMARNRGKGIERELWKSWGGAPTTQLFRHRGEANSPRFETCWDNPDGFTLRGMVWINGVRKKERKSFD